MVTKIAALLLLLCLLTLPALARTLTPPATESVAAATESIAVTLEATDSMTPEATDTMTPEATESRSGLVGDPVRGQAIFEHGLNGAPACANCHSRDFAGKRGFVLAPGLKDVSLRAATRIAGISAPQYLEDSIRHPGDYVVSGFREIMYPNFGRDYSNQEIDDLVAYLMTL